MFPLNQDTFIEYSGNTANDLYSDGYGYIYMMKEGRGRSSSGGNLLFSKTVDNWYFEVNTWWRTAVRCLSIRTIMVTRWKTAKMWCTCGRWVAAWQSGAWSAAAAIESNLVNNAYGYQSQSGRWVDQSNRTGYGLTMSWNTLKSDPQDGAVVNLSTALLDAADETDFSAGINALWHRVELGYIYAHNKIDQFNMAGVTSECDGDCAILAPGRYDIHTLHTSWQLPNIMAMPNFNIYLGAYASWLDSTAAKSGNPDERYGARVRFKYFF